MTIDPHEPNAPSADAAGEVGAVGTDSVHDRPTRRAVGVTVAVTIVAIAGSVMALDAVGSGSPASRRGSTHDNDAPTLTRALAEPPLLPRDWTLSDGPTR